MKKPLPRLDEIICYGFFIWIALVVVSIPVSVIAAVYNGAKLW